MASHPTVVMLHSLHTSHAHDAPAERAAIEDRLGIEVPLARNPAESLELLADAEVALCTGISQEQLDAAEHLRWVQTFSSGFDAFPLDRLDEAGIVLTNMSGVPANPIAEHVLGLMLLFSRRFHRGMRQQSESRWEYYSGGELKGRTLGIVGLGAIGSRIAELGKSLDMRVLGSKQNPQSAPGIADEVYGPDALHELLSRADYLVLSCPLTESTRGMIGASELGAMKDSSVLINVARGELVDSRSLLVALQNRQIRGAGLDVFPEEPLDTESPLWDLPNVVLTPHMAGTSPRTPDRIAALFAENYDEFDAGDLDSMPTRVV